MSAVKRARGFSLLEVMVAGVLLILILTLIMQVVVPMGRGSVRGSQQIELQQTTTTALSRLVADLETAPPAGLARFPDVGPAAPGQPLILSIQAFTGVDMLGQQTWSEQLVIYWWRESDGKLWRMTWPPGFPLGRRPDIDEPFKPTLSELRRLIANPRGSQKLLGKLKTFDLDLSVVPHELSLSAEAPAPDAAPPEQFRLARRLYLRNERY